MTKVTGLLIVLLLTVCGCSINERIAALEERVEQLEAQTIQWEWPSWPDDDIEYFVYPETYIETTTLLLGDGFTEDN